MQEGDFARNTIAPPNGICRSSFFEAMRERGLEKFLFVFQELQKNATKILPQKFPEIGKLIAIDGSLTVPVLSMEWAAYRDGAKKAKAHIGFDINHPIPKKIFLTDGNGGERHFGNTILEPGETDVMGRGYQSHKDFDLWQTEGKHFACRIKGYTAINLP